MKDVRFISSEQVNGLLPNANGPRIVGQVWRVYVTVDGAPASLKFAQLPHPTDDEILAALGLTEDTVNRQVLPATLAAKIDAVAKVADMYLTFRSLTELADFGALFTLQERNRITSARDLTLAAIKEKI